MSNILKKASSIGLVLVLMATTLVSFPSAVAPPPDKCEPCLTVSDSLGY
jgi:hypothetical protein